MSHLSSDGVPEPYSESVA